MSLALSNDWVFFLFVLRVLRKLEVLENHVMYLIESMKSIGRSNWKDNHLKLLPFDWFTSLSILQHISLELSERTNKKSFDIILMIVGFLNEKRRWYIDFHLNLFVSHDSVYLLLPFFLFDRVLVFTRVYWWAAWVQRRSSEKFHDHKERRHDLSKSHWSFHDYSLIETEYLPDE